MLCWLVFYVFSFFIQSDFTAGCKVEGPYKVKCTSQTEQSVVHIRLLHHHHLVTEGQRVFGSEEFNTKDERKPPKCHVPFTVIRHSVSNSIYSKLNKLMSHKQLVKQSAHRFLTQSSPSWCVWEVKQDLQPGQHWTSLLHLQYIT